MEKAVRDLKVSYPVAIDSDYKIWQAFHNEYWPAHYFIDGKGRIRYHHFGEGEYDESERVIQECSKRTARQSISEGVINVSGSGAEAAPDKETRALPRPISVTTEPSISVLPSPLRRTRAKFIRCFAGLP